MMRQVIVEAIEKRLRDVFPSVFAWRTTDFAAEELPAIVYRDTHDEVTVTVGCHLHKLTLECNLYCLGEARDMRQMLAVLVRTIGADVTWGALAEDTQIEAGSETTIAEQNDRKVWHSHIKFGIEYLTDPWEH
jgi:hypothetical protein